MGKSAPRRPRRPKVIKIASDFTGLDTASVALGRMGVDHVNIFCSDTDSNCKTIVEHLHSPL
eukprot:297754-Pyramimonas_sp.AAC.1